MARWFKEENIESLIKHKTGHVDDRCVSGCPDHLLLTGVYVGGGFYFLWKKLSGCTHFKNTQSYSWETHLQPMSFSASDFCLCFLWKAFLHGCCLSRMASYLRLLFPFRPLTPSECVCPSVRLAFSGMIRGAVKSVPLYANPALVVAAISVPRAGKVFTSEKEPIHASMHAMKATIWTVVSYHFLA